MTAGMMIAEDAIPGFCATILSMIPSPFFLDFVVVYGDSHFRRAATVPSNPVTYHQSAKAKAENPQRHQQRFKLFREMYQVREFRLVLCACVAHPVMERSIRTLEEVVKAERKKGGLDYLRWDPLIVSEIQRSHYQLDEDRVVHCNT